VSGGALVARLGIAVDPELLVLALTHRSFAYEAGGIPTNERLEFLGDAVLGIVVTERLYRAFPDQPEGVLARMRAATVSQRALAEIARDLDVGSFVLLGKGELATGGRDKDSILSDTMEALFGAVYLCHGLEPTRTLIERLVAPMIERASTAGAGLDWKTSLQEAAAVRGLGAPSYQVTGEGPAHARVFAARVLLGGEVLGEGAGTAKKVAEQEAARTAYLTLTSSADERAAGGPGERDQPPASEGPTARGGPTARA